MSIFGQQRHRVLRHRFHTLGSRALHHRHARFDTTKHVKVDVKHVLRPFLGSNQEVVARGVEKLSEVGELGVVGRGSVLGLREIEGAQRVGNGSRGWLEGRGDVFHVDASDQLWYLLGPLGLVLLQEKQVDRSLFALDPDAVADDWPFRRDVDLRNI